jgi:hypothetical protein
MTFAELAEAATKLPPEERRMLLEIIARSLGEGEPRPTRSAAEMRGRFAPGRSALDHLRGVARPAGPPPTDDEVMELVTDYLVEKYR